MSDEEFPGSNNVKSKNFDQEEILADDDTEINYFKLMAHIKQNHPTTGKGYRYGVCTEIGAFPCLNCCYDKQKDNEVLKIKIT